MTFHISLAADPVLRIGNLYLTNTILTTWFTMAVLVFFSFLVRYQLKKRKETRMVVGGKILVNFFYKYINSILENEELSWQVLPLISTLFVFITFANFLGLFPGLMGSFILKTKEGVVPLFRTINSDLNTTFAMAISGIIIIKIESLHFPEAKSYLKIGVNRIFRVIIGFFELLSEMTRIISLSFRLTGNIFAGEILLLVIGFLLPYFLPIPFMFLEIFIGAIQALVFSTLVLVFVKW